MGKKALLLKGISFCKLQLEKGVTEFFGSDEINTESIHYDYPNESVTEHADAEDIQITTDYIKEVGAELSVQFADSSEFCEVLLESGKIWYMPKDCCQSFLNGANGSNACMIIALLAGHAISGTDDLHNDISIGTIKANILSSFLGCIDVGNTLYDTNNLSGFLDIVQGITAIGHSIDLYTAFSDSFIQ